MPRHGGVAGRGQPGRARDRGRVGLGGVADAHPDERVLLDDRVALQPGGARHPGLAGDGDAAAVGAVGEAVVAADHLVVDQPARRLGQREAAVHAAVRHGGDLARLGAPEQDRLAADGAAEQLPADLAAVGRDVPLVGGNRRHRRLLRTSDSPAGRPVTSMVTSVTCTAEHRFPHAGKRTLASGPRPTSGDVHDRLPTSSSTLCAAATTIWRPWCAACRPTTSPGGPERRTGTCRRCSATSAAVRRSSWPPWRPRWTAPPCRAETSTRRSGHAGTRCPRSSGPRAS